MLIFVVYMKNILTYLALKSFIIMIHDNSEITRDLAEISEQTEDYFLYTGYGRA